MASEYVLVRDDNKEMFNLGKTPSGMDFVWWDVPKFYDAKPKKRESLNEWEFKECVYKFVFKELDMLKEYLIQTDYEPHKFLIPYYKYVFDDLYKWSDGKEVYVGFDDMEFDLKKQGYKVTGSRYKTKNEIVKSRFDLIN